MTPASTCLILLFHLILLLYFSLESAADFSTTLNLLGLGSSVCAAQPVVLLAVASRGSQWSP